MLSVSGLMLHKVLTVSMVLFCLMSHISHFFSMDKLELYPQIEPSYILDKIALYAGLIFFIFECIFAF